MLLESQLNDRTMLVIDAESVGGLDKGASSLSGHPDKIVPRAIEIIQAVASQLGAAQVDNGASSMEIRFAVRVDSNSCVSIARSATEGQFQVLMRWSKD